MVWFFALLTGVFVYLLLPWSPWVNVLAAVAVTAGLFVLALRLNGPRDVRRRR